MSLIEKFREIEDGKTGLFQRLVQKRKLQEFSQFVAAQYNNLVRFPHPTPALYDVRRRLTASGVVEALMEAIDYFPTPPLCSIEPELNISNEKAARTESAQIRIRWNIETIPQYGSNVFVDRGRELVVITPLGSDKIIVRTKTFSDMRGDAPENERQKWINTYSKPPYSQVLFETTLTQQQLQDRELVEAAIADALWYAGVRPKPKTEILSFPEDSFEEDQETDNPSTTDN